MGSARQADTLVSLHNRVRLRTFKGPLNAEEEARMRAMILAADLDTIREWFAEVNAELGFDRRTSPATAEQIGYLRRQEQKVYGAPRTSFRDGLTFEAAHKRIEAFKGAA
jgi:hypothetical protein